MKNLNENAMMQEMTLQEMKEVNGGSGLGAALKILEKAVVLVGAADAVDRFVKGWNEAGDSREFR